MPERIEACSGMVTQVLDVRDPSLGIDGAYREVFVSRKPPDG